MVHHLYVHIPFCPKICPYCSFYKSEAAAGGFAEFVDAVLAEARCWQGEALPRTVFFGGGTPTALSQKHLETLIGGLHEIFDFSGVVEFTVEMNPATVSPGKAKALRGLGVNRASMGVQSWDPHVLLTLGRSHTAETARRTFHTLEEAGFTNINLDHIFGVPGQTSKQWSQTLETSLALRPAHISAYSLTYEEDTEFFLRQARGELVSDPVLDADFFDLAASMLEAEGYEHYETSNYAKPGLRCEHNLALWMGADYLGLGPSAVSTIAGVRHENIADTTAYIAAVHQRGDAIARRETLTAADAHLERIALGLRTSDGVSAKILPADPVETLQREGLLTRRGPNVSLTRRGRALADEVALALLPDQPA